MNLRTLCLLSALVVAASLSPASATAASRSSSTPSTRVHALVVRQSAKTALDREPAERAPAKRSGHAAATHATASARGLEHRRMSALMLRQDRERLHEQAEADGRARRIYAVSQTSAPIIADTRACRRVGPNGESVYENCALAGAGAASR